MSRRISLVVVTGMSSESKLELELKDSSLSKLLEVSESTSMAQIVYQ